MNDTLERLNVALVGRYRLERELGRGGMAVVYLAEDLRHHRRVALKVLTPDVVHSLGPARFLREVAIAGQLNHPHILPLFDSGEAGGLLWYVMPYVDGESLRSRLARPMDTGESVRILREVADALSYAHERGIIHRDIKPENVLLSGRHALVSDFGIAKAVSEATGVQGATGTGIAIGTPAYMSPEQATADPRLDHRTDIYSFGVMAYEMLSGKPPFADEALAAVVAAHLTRQPPALARPGIPPSLAALVMGCLAKDPGERPPSAASLVERLESGERTGLVPPRRFARRSVVGGILVMALGTALMIQAARSAPTPLTVGRSTVVAAGQELEIAPAISPDGKLIAYAAGTSVRMGIWVRGIDGSRAIRLTGDTTLTAAAPRWSPDGTRILYGTTSGLWIAPALGGTARQVVSVPADRLALSGAWSPDGQSIAYPMADTLFVVPATGGSPRPVGTGSELHSCDWSPGGSWIACASDNSVFALPSSVLGNIGASRIMVFSVGGGRVRLIGDSAALNQSPAWGLDDREIFFVSDVDGSRDIFRQLLTRDGEPLHPAERLTVGLNAHSIDVSRDGRQIAYAVFTSEANAWALPIPSSGPVSIMGARELTFEHQTVESVIPSRDGRWLLYDSDLAGNSDLYRLPLPTGEVERLTSDPGNEFRPEISPDGRAVVFQSSTRTGTRDIYLLPLDGGPVQALTSSEAHEARPTWSPDGTRLAFLDLRWPGAVLVMSRAAGAPGWDRPLRVDSGGMTSDYRCVPAPDWDFSGQSLVYCHDGRVVLNELAVGRRRTVFAPRPSLDDPVVYWVVASKVAPVAYFRGQRPTGEDGLWAIPFAGGSPRLLVRLDDAVRPSPSPFFSVDARSFYLTRTDRQSDIRVASLERP